MKDGRCDIKGITELLISRLERLSADSIWAHRASGVRGSLLRNLQNLDSLIETQHLEVLIEMGFEILNKAAGDIPSGGENK